MERTSYSKLSQRDVDRAETDLLINLSAITPVSYTHLDVYKRQVITSWSISISIDAFQS